MEFFLHSSWSKSAFFLRFQTFRSLAARCNFLSMVRRSSTSDEGGIRDAQGEGGNFESNDSSEAKKMKRRQKYLKISADDLWRVRDKLGTS